MARTKSLAKRIAEAPKPSDGSEAPIRCLVLKIEAANPDRARNHDYAYVTLEFSIALIAYDGSEKADGHYKTTSKHDPDSTYWAYWPHVPAWGEPNIAFRYAFNAKAEMPECPTFPVINMLGFEPSLEQASAGVAFAQRTVTTLRMLSESLGNASSFPEAVARLMQATECTAVAIRADDFAEFTGKPTPPHKAHCAYRVFPGIADARGMAEDVYGIAISRYRAKESND